MQNFQNFLLLLLKETYNGGKKDNVLSVCFVILTHYPNIEMVRYKLLFKGSGERDWER